MSEYFMENKNKITFWDWKPSKSKNIEPDQNFPVSYKEICITKTFNICELTCELIVNYIRELPRKFGGSYGRLSYKWIKLNASVMLERLLGWSFF